MSKSPISSSPLSRNELDDLAAEYHQCLFLNTIKVARVMTRRFDQRLAPHSITATQFFVLMFVRYNEGETINALSQQMDMDRSTLTRNMDGLVRKKLVVKQMIAKGNAKTCVLTDEGNRLLDLIIPEWLASRKALEERLEGRDIKEYRRILDLLSE